MTYMYIFTCTSIWYVLMYVHRYHMYTYTESVHVRVEECLWVGGVGDEMQERDKETKEREREREERDSHKLAHTHTS